MKGNKFIPVKKNLSSIHVLKTLQVLMQGHYTMSELIKKLNENERIPVFNNSVVSKYINTCRYCGIQIPKIQNRYHVTKIPFGLNITDPEYNLMLMIQNKAKKSISLRSYKSFERFIMKLSDYSNQKISKTDENEFSKTQMMFEDAIKNKRKILIMLKNKANIECIPLGICENKNKIYFQVFCNEKEKLIFTERVSAIKILNERFNTVKRDMTVTFKLTGKLAQNYTPRENEKIIDSKLPEFITVSNGNENILMLIPRLMRYGNLCEVLSPFSVRTEMGNAIIEALANYGEN